MTAPAAPGLYTDDNPFKFLDYFEEADRDVFAGRDRELREALARITACPTSVLYGKAGVGKTSFVLAGLFPALRAKEFRPVYVRTLRSPVEDLRDALRAEVLRDESGNGPRTAAPRPQPVVLAFDQFEEFFLRFGAGDRAAFVDELQRLARQPGLHLRMLFSLREDFLAPLDELRPALPDLSANQYRLGPLSAFGAREAIEKPLRRAGVPYERGLLSRLIDTLAPGAGPEAGFDPPLLQILCSELYHECRHEPAPPAPRLTVAGLERLGGLDGVFRRFLDRALSNLPGDPRNQSLVRLVIDAVITEKRTKLAVTVDDLLAGPFVAGRAEVEAVLEALRRQRLLRMDLRRGVAWYELVHERLVDFLVKWLEADPEVFALRAARQAVHNAAAGGLWRLRPGLLLSDSALTGTIGPHKDRLRPDEDGLELLFRSALVHRHDDCAFWAGRLGTERARSLVLRLLTEPAPAGAKPAEWHDLRLGAAWAAGRLFGTDEALAKACLAVALADDEADKVRRAAGAAFARNYPDDRRGALVGDLGLPSNRRRLGQLAAAVGDWVMGAGPWLASLGPWTSSPARPAARAESGYQARLGLLADLYDARRPPAGVPQLVRWEAQRLARDRAWKEQHDVIRERADRGRGVGFRAGIAWALLFGVPCSWALGWVLGVYGWQASLQFVSASVGVALPLAMGLGLMLGHFAARAAARAAVAGRPTGWARVVLHDPWVFGTLFVGLWLGAVGFITRWSNWDHVLGVAVATAAALLLVGGFAALVRFARAVVGQSRKARTWAWAAVASLGLPHLAGYGVLVLGYSLDAAAAWGLASFVGIYLSFALFVLTMTLARTTHAGHRSTEPRRSGDLARAAAAGLVLLALGLFVYLYHGLIPLGSGADLGDLTDDEPLVLTGRNAWALDASVYPLYAPALTLLEIAPRTPEDPARSELLLDEEAARFERRDRQFFLLPTGWHFAVVRPASAHAAGDRARAGPGMPATFHLSKYGADGAPAVEAGGGERFAWCVLQRPAGGQWSGSLRFLVPPEARAPFLAVSVARQFFGLRAEGAGPAERVATWSREGGDLSSPPSQLSQTAEQPWLLQLSPGLGDVTPPSADPADGLRQVRATQRIDFPAPEQPTGLFRVAAGNAVTLNLAVAPAAAFAGYDRLLVLVSLRLTDSAGGAPLRDAITEDDPVQRSGGGPVKLRCHYHWLNLERGRSYFVAVAAPRALNPDLVVEDQTGKVHFRAAQESAQEKERTLKWGIFTCPKAAKHALVVAAARPGPYEVVVTPLALQPQGLQAELVHQPTDFPSKAFPLDLESNCVYQVSLEPSTFRGTLSLEDEGGGVRTFSAPDAKRITYYSGAKSRKTLVVCGNGQKETGLFWVKVAKYQPLAAGGRQEGALEPKLRRQRGKFFQEFPLTLQPDASYCIDLKSKDFDAYLILENDGGTVLAEDDDSGGNQNARLFFEPTVAEPKAVIKATSYGIEETGSFVLEVRKQIRDRDEPQVLEGRLEDERKYQRPVGFHAWFEAKPGGRCVIRCSNANAAISVADERRARVLSFPGQNGGIDLFLDQLDGQRYEVKVTVDRADPQRGSLDLYWLEEPLYAKAAELREQDLPYAVPGPARFKRYPSTLRGGRYYLLQLDHDAAQLSVMVTAPQVRHLKAPGSRWYFRPSAVGTVDVLASAGANGKGKPIVTRVEYALHIQELTREAYYGGQVVDSKFIKTRWHAQKTLIDLAWAYCMLDRWDEARTELDGIKNLEALAKEDIARYWNVRAWVADHADDLNAAVAAWEQVLAYDPGFFDMPDEERLESKRKSEEARKRRQAAAGGAPAPR
jgi:hypothetical protein